MIALPQPPHLDSRFKKRLCTFSCTFPIQILTFLPMLQKMEGKERGNGLNYCCWFTKMNMDGYPSRGNWPKLRLIASSASSNCWTEAHTHRQLHLASLFLHIQLTHQKWFNSSLDAIRDHEEWNNEPKLFLFQEGGENDVKSLSPVCPAYKSELKDKNKSTLVTFYD